MNIAFKTDDELKTKNVCLTAAKSSSLCLDREKKIFLVSFTFILSLLPVSFTNDILNYVEQ